ncbi:hypothetical protein FRC03_005279 [Tulasnella sp. 419]|nr:hypothetical protein FRC03_005279 [Tulasnella sp. 419]
MPPKNEKRVKKRAKHQTRSQTPKTSGKAKKVPVQKSRVAGRLAELMNMPVDVFAECLRSILMSKSAKHIWRGARENQLPTLPPCPDDLSEPQYIALLFTNICQVCGANRAQRLHVTMRTPCCGSCSKTPLLSSRLSVASTFTISMIARLNKFCQRCQEKAVSSLCLMLSRFNLNCFHEGSQDYENNSLQLETYLTEYRTLKSAKLREQYIVTLEQKPRRLEKLV